MTQPPAIPLQRGRSFADAAGVIGIATGIAVVLGWLLHIPVLMSLLPGAATMKANAALCFILTGMALVSLRKNGAASVSPRLRRVVWFCAGAVVLTGILTLCENGFGWNPGIDQFAIRDDLSQPGTFPGRMASGSALSFVLLGLAHLLMNEDSRRGHRPAQVLALITLLIGLLGLLGYVYRAPILHRLAGYTSMAVHTAGLFVILGVGTLFARPDRGLMRVITSEHGGGRMIRRILPVAITLPFVLGWLRLEGQNAGWFGMEFGLALFATSNSVCFTVLLWCSARTLNRFDARRAETAESLRRTDAVLERRAGELEESERRFRFLADRIPQIIWTSTPDGNLDYYNQRWFDYTGMTLAQTQGWGWEPVVHPEDLQNCIDRWTKAYTTGCDYEVEYRFKRASDGEYRWHLGRAFPLRNEQGQIVQWVGTCTDIEDQRRARADLERLVRERTSELSAARELLRQVLEAATGVSIIATDSDGLITLFNSGSERMLGYRADEMVGRETPAILHLGSEVIARGEELTREFGRRIEGFDAFVEHARQGRHETREWTYLRKDGEALTALLDVTATRGEAGEINGFLGVAVDVTEQKRTGAALKKAHRELGKR